LNSEVIWPMFTKFLHYVDVLLPLLMRAFIRPIVFRFRTPEQRVKAVNFEVCKMPQKLIGYQFGCHKIYVNLISIIHISTKDENLARIGPVLAEIFGEIYRFLRLVQKGAVITIVISGVTGPILINFAQNVATILLFNNCKSKLRYSNPFRNTSVLNEGFANFAQNRLP